VRLTPETRALAFTTNQSQVLAHFDSPFVVCALTLMAQGLAVLAGDLIRKHARRFRKGERHDFATIQTATLTLTPISTARAAVIRIVPQNLQAAAQSMQQQ